MPRGGELMRSSGEEAFLVLIRDVRLARERPAYEGWNHTPGKALSAERHVACAEARRVARHQQPDVELFAHAEEHAR